MFVCACTLRHTLATLVKRTQTQAHTTCQLRIFYFLRSSMECGHMCISSPTWPPTCAEVAPTATHWIRRPNTGTGALIHKCGHNGCIHSLSCLFLLFGAVVYFMLTNIFLIYFSKKVFLFSENCFCLHLILLQTSASADFCILDTASGMYM